MNNYFVVATAKHMLNLRGKQYKIGDTIPTELTEKEYEFYKNALNVESVTRVHLIDKKDAAKNIDQEVSLKINLITAMDRIKELEAELERYKNKTDGAELGTTESTETEVKLKRPYTKKVKEDV